ncbi:MAG: aminoacyl-histidine dipeptidase [Bacteroidales bacterium]|nr:aminoacyl-histidine dipeptidase [Bacteroidales bacterium]
MDNPLHVLKPYRLWHYFAEICEVPRPSKKEEKIAKYLVDFAVRYNLEVILDETGNVLIRKPASPGYEKRKAVILQSHMDMVGEKNSDSNHNFAKDPIRPRIEGDWVKATGTTLGADCGIGIAASLAVLEANDIPHPPLEALFTMDEETGLTGAFGLKHDLLQGKILINLDSEDEGQLFIGCAGGKDTMATFLMETEPIPSNQVAFDISITGLVGGHSGDDINKGRGNAVKILGRFLWNASNEFDAHISSLDAGNLRNALAREGFAQVVIPEGSADAFQTYAQVYHSDLVRELHITEPDLRFAVVNSELPPTVLTAGLQERLLNAIYACPHGVIAMSREIKNFVETSTNLASVKMKNDKIVITTSQRSSVESSKKDVGDMLASLFHLAGAQVEQTAGYPGWNPNPDSEILRLTVASYRELFGKDPEVLAIHAGLECGLIGAIYPGMDMVSFGPTIKGAHSPDERLNIPTTVKFWDLLVDVLKEIPTK